MNFSDLVTEERNLDTLDIDTLDTKTMLKKSTIRIKQCLLR